MDAKREQELKLFLVKVKLGQRFKFVVTEVNGDYTLSTMVGYSEITGKVDYESYYLGYSFNPSEHFEVGDEFEGEVLSKQPKRTLVIKPTLNLKEIKDKSRKNDLLEKWMRNEL